VRSGVYIAHDEAGRNLIFFAALSCAPPALRVPEVRQQDRLPHCNVIAEGGRDGDDDGGTVESFQEFDQIALLPICEVEFLDVFVQILLGKPPLSSKSTGGVGLWPRNMDCPPATARESVPRGQFRPRPQRSGLERQQSPYFLRNPRT